MRVEAERFTRSQYATAAAVLGLAAETRRAYYGAVAARELLAYAEQAKMVADASAELAQRMRSDALQSGGS
jgi:outer membrane protein TolC